MEKQTIIFMLIVACCAISVSATFSIDAPQFFPINNSEGIDIYATSVLNSSVPATIVYSWYADNVLVQNTTFTNVGNGSQLTDALFQDSYTPGQTLFFILTANNGTVLLTQQAQVAQCNDGIDNDGDGFTDFGSDPDCISFEDNSEAAGSSCTTTGGGSYTAPSSTTPSTSFTTTSSGSSTDQFLSALQETVSTEIPCNGKDDNGNGFIDENCPNRNITITTDTGAKRFVLYVPPGSMRTDRAVKITNAGTQTIPINVSCQGGTACNYLLFTNPTRNVAASIDLPEKIPFTLSPPLTEATGTVYLLKLIVTDLESGQQDNILLELHIDSRLPFLASLDSVLGVPYCRGIGTGKPLCVSGYGILGTLFGVSVVLFVLRYIFKKKQP